MSETQPFPKVPAGDLPNATVTAIEDAARKMWRERTSQIMPGPFVYLSEGGALIGASATEDDPAHLTSAFALGVKRVYVFFRDDWSLVAQFEAPAVAIARGAMPSKFHIRVDRELTDDKRTEYNATTFPTEGLMLDSSGETAAECLLMMVDQLFAMEAQDYAESLTWTVEKSDRPGVTEFADFRDVADCAARIETTPNGQLTIGYRNQFAPGLTRAHVVAMLPLLHRFAASGKLS